MVRCPVCACDWENVATTAPPTRCVCGYSFATGDTTIVLDTLRRTHRAAVRLVCGGIALFAGGLVLVVFGGGMLGAGTCVLGGAALVVHYLPRAVRSTRQIRDARALSKLPTARLLGAPKV